MTKAPSGCAYAILAWMTAGLLPSPSLRRLWLLGSLSLLFEGACATARLDDPPITVEVAVKGLKPEERTELEGQLCALDGVSHCEVEEKKGQVRYFFTYARSLSELRSRISKLPHPGLEAKAAEAFLSYRGFDNRAPSVEVLGPQDGAVITDRAVVVDVRSVDRDTESIRVGNVDATRGAGTDSWSATINLKEGENDIDIIATDDAGNEAAKKVRLIVDTTPPELEVEVEVLSFDKAVVRGVVRDGKVKVDAKDASVDLLGKFELPVTVDPDKQDVVVSAVDPHGNTISIRRSLRAASKRSAQSD